jgi:membrane protein YqaA with SNARE-associated domain
MQFKKTKLYQYRGLVVVVLVIVLLFVVFSFIKPQDIVQSLGVRNSYLVLFLIGLIGGASSLTSSSYYAAVVTFAVSGLNPVIIAFVAGTALFIGDSVFYRIGMWGRDHISGRALRFAQKLTRYVEGKSRRFVQVFIYLYTGFSPFPADILMISLSFVRFPYLSFMVPGFMGSVTFAFLLAFLAAAGGV